MKKWSEVLIYPFFLLLTPPPTFLRRSLSLLIRLISQLRFAIPQWCTLNIYEKSWIHPSRTLIYSLSHFFSGYCLAQHLLLLLLLLLRVIDYSEVHMDFNSLSVFMYGTDGTNWPWRIKDQSCRSRTQHFQFKK